MDALTVVPGEAGSLAISDVPQPKAAPTELLVAGLAVGICGTDREIVAGEHGSPPPESERLIIGHESIGRVVDGPSDSSYQAGDLVVGVVRRPDPVPCGACARGEFDMCRNGRYTERGIKELDGYASTSWTVPPEYAVRVGPELGELGVLTEPASIVAKAWDQIDRVGSRSWYDPRCVLVTGAGPIGLLAAMIGVLRGLDVHVLDRVTSGPKPDLVTDLGATYHHEPVAELADKIEPDIVIEATGAGRLVLEAMTITGPYGIVCLTGVSSPGRTLNARAAEINREIVLENDVVVGSVNANLAHYRSALAALAEADRDWLRRLISRRVPLHRYPDGFRMDADDVKVVLTLDT